MQLIACVAVALSMLLASGVLLTVNSSCTTNVLSRTEIQSLLSGVTGQHSSGDDSLKKRGVSGAKGKKKKKKEMNNLKETDKQQSLLVNQKINCTGQLTKWIFAAKWQNNKRDLPELQVWRLASGADSTTYNKIHSTTVNVNSENTEKIYEFTLPTPIDVIAGDVLSVFQPKKKDSKLIVYFHEGGETDKYTYYLEKTDNSIGTVDIQNTKDEVAKPLVTAIISQVLISSTSVSTSCSTSCSTSVSTEYQSSSTVQVRTDVSPLISSQRPVLRTSTTVNRMISVLTSSVSLVPSPTTTSLVMPVQTTTPCMQTCSTTRETHSETIHSSWVSKTMIDQTQYLLPSNTGIGKLSINSATVPNTLSTTPTSCINTCTSTSSAVQSSFMLKSTNVQANSTSVNDCDKTACNTELTKGLPSLAGANDFPNSIIILVIIFATIFTCGMTVITVCVLCVIVFLFKRNKDDNEKEMMSYPAGSKQNRYIQKTVTSPMYEGIDAADSSVQQPPPPTVPPVAPLSLPFTINEPHVQINNPNKTPTLSSVGSSCSSVTVQPDVIVNIKHSYDHLSAKWKEEKSNTKPSQKATTISNPVSPYEKPVLPDEANIPIGYYELADEIYVPTEDQRQMVTDMKGPDKESLLYKSLYEAQHETTSSDDDDDADKQNESKGKKEFFKETQEYWKPSYTKQAIYQQLANKRFREVPRHKIRVIEYLGSGQFATVNKAMWKMAGGDVEVAVKMIKEGAPEEERIKFLREAAINGQFHHLNVVRLLGVVTVGEPTMIILELLRNGNLKKYLTSRRKPIKGEIVSPELLLNFSKQVCSGMEYLAKKTFVHRDVAARNILVSDQLICKVADFGMSRDLEENSYYVSQGGLVPIKWTAPEALYYRKFSTASDVWSYGVLLFEIWSFGKKPFSTVTNEQYIDNVDEGKRLAPPPGCPRPIYQMMIDCWHPEASERPTFTEIYQQFESSSESLLLSLGITDDELVESPQCDVLGAPLESGSSLFLDLQMKYYNM